MIFVIHLNIHLKSKYEKSNISYKIVTHVSLFSIGNILNVKIMLSNLTYE